MSFAARCFDCGINTTPNDDRGRAEWYMVHDHVWHAAGMPERDPSRYGANILCIGCLEMRLGRRLQPADFIEADVNQPKRSYSARLNARLTGSGESGPPVARVGPVEAVRR